MRAPTIRRRRCAATRRCRPWATCEPGTRAEPRGSALLSLTHLIATYGYVVVAAFVMIEGMGAPLPGEVVLLTGAAFAAQGHLEIIGVVIASWIGTLLGGTGGYWIGRIGGAPLLGRYGHFVGLNPSRVAWANGYFDRHGAKTIVVARFVAVLRMVAGILAGITRMSFGVFSIANAVGGALWSIAFGALGYIFGRNLPNLEDYLRRFSFGALILAVIVAIGMWQWRRRRPAP